MRGRGRRRGELLRESGLPWAGPRPRHVHLSSVSGQPFRVPGELPLFGTYFRPLMSRIMYRLFCVRVYVSVRLSMDVS